MSISIKSHLEPLAIASNMIQSAICRLDEVLITFGWLYLEFEQLNDAVDQRIKNAVLSSIEKRWEKCDQEVFLAAAILNPFIRTSPFQPLPCLNLMGIITMFSRLYKRFFGVDVPANVITANVQDYFNNSGLFHDFPGMKNAILLQAVAEVSI
jgi:hypothetical protein